MQPDGTQTSEKRSHDAERVWVEALKKGDAEAYEKLVREQTPILLAVTRRILRDEEEAKDAVQEAFVSAFKAIGGFDGQAKLSTWLHRIAINAALMKLRKRPRGRERPIDDLLPKYMDDGHMLEPAADWDVLPETAVQNRETADLVRRSIDQLPDTYRTVLLMRDIEQLDTAETAEILDVSTNVVKVRLHRARQALRTLLDPHFRGGSL